MKKFRLYIAVIAQLTCATATSISFASTGDETAGVKNVGTQASDNAETRQPRFSDMDTASTCDVTTATMSAENIAPSFGANGIHPDDAEAAVLSWLENEMQMSLDPSSEPQGITPDFTCMNPPHDCPANVKPDFLPRAVCIVTSCGLGACPTCPAFIPGLAIRAWCAYGCMSGSKVVGGCFGFWTRLGNRWLGPYCFAG